MDRSSHDLVAVRNQARTRVLRTPGPEAPHRSDRLGWEHVFVREDADRLKCYMCGELKPAADFAWRLKKAGRRDSFCRPCRVIYSRKYYLANKQRYIARAAKAKRKIALERTRYLLEFFKSHPCTDCGETDPIVLEFDHVDPSTKSFRHRDGAREAGVGIRPGRDRQVRGRVR
jgi:hypothetical protein